MDIIINETYIEKKRYFKNRVVTVKSVKDAKVYVFNWKLPDLTLTNTCIKLSDFQKKFERSWLRMIVRR